VVYLLDTNVLLRLTDRRNPQHPLVRTAVRKLHRQGHQLAVTSQNCVEYWNVSTRPVARNGFGLAPGQTDRFLARIERLFRLLPDDPRVYAEWRRLVLHAAVAGVQVHDARLAAAMIVRGVSHILTLNIGDFSRYHTDGIVAVDPSLV